MLVLIVCCMPAAVSLGQDLELIEFERRQLTNVYYSEGIAAGDLNGDEHPDVVYGPFWFAGPDFDSQYELYPAVSQPMERYADHFFAWCYDFNGDGLDDVLTVGFPGTPAYVYENPGTDAHGEHWPKHEVLDWVSNESPHFTDIVGDERPELVCTRDGFFGFAAFDSQQPFSAWRFHALSEQIAPPRFGHGLGVGDINGDSRADLVFSGGWFEQPASGATRGRWRLHRAQLSRFYGGAEMLAYDVDGDGDTDIVTSEAAHDFGLSWYEQQQVDGEVQFRRHQIMGDQPHHNRYGVVFSELHSVQLADINDDGLLDIVTGKTYWSHHRQSPMWDAGAVVYWFELTREGGDVRWIPRLADDQAGIGRQVRASDVNRDGRTDLLSGGMLGAHVLVQRRRIVDRETWRDAQPRPYDGPPTLLQRGPEAEINAETGRVPQSIEAEAMPVARATGGSAAPQDMSGFRGGRWSGDQQLFWTGGEVGDTLSLTLELSESVTCRPIVAFTMARDYARVRVRMNDQVLAESLDLYHYPGVSHSGELELDEVELAAGTHQLHIEIVGRNPASIPKYFVGIDYIKLDTGSHPDP